MADTEVGGLVVKMKADLSDYMQKLDQMEKGTASTSGKVEKAFTGITSVIAKAGAALGTAAVTSINAAMKWGNAVDDLGDKTGMTGEACSRLLVLAKRVGIGAEEASGMFSRFARSAYNAAEAQVTAANAGKQSDDAFTKMGISLVDADNRMKDTSEIFSEVKSAIADMPDGLAKTATEMEVFGRSGAAMHDLLNMTDEEMQNVIQRAQEMGMILSTDQAAAWEQFERDINTAKSSLTAIGITIGNEMMPQLKGMLNDIQNLTKSYVSLDGKQKELVNGVITLVAQIGAATLAVKGLEWVIGRSLGPWGLLAVAIWKATGALRDWNIESQQQQRAQNGGQWVNRYISEVDPASGRTINKHAGQIFIHDIGDDNRSGRYDQEPSPEAGKPEPEQPVITGSAGDSDGNEKDSKTELQAYQEVSGKLLSTWQDMVNLNEISRSGFRDLLSERLTGLDAIAVGEDEELDKQQAQYSLRSQIASLDQQIRQTAIETAAKKVALGEITVEQYRDEIKAAQELATTDDERMSLAQKLSQENDRIISDSITAQERLNTAKKAALSIDEETARHNLKMSETFSGDTVSEKRSNWSQELALKQKNLEDEYALESKSIDDTISLYEDLKRREGKLTQDQQKQYDSYLDKKSALDAKYVLNKEQLENSYAEKVAAQQKTIIDANNSMITDLILGTKNGHDILEKMWDDFVGQVVTKMFAIQSETNIFTNLLGGLFGLGSSGTNLVGTRPDNVSGPVGSNGGFYTVSGARAGGGDVEAGKSYIVGEKGIELFSPSQSGRIIPNSAITSGSTQSSSELSNSVNVNINQSFQGQQDSSVVAQIKESLPIIKREIINAIKNETAMRNAVKGAAT